MGHFADPPEGGQKWHESDDDEEEESFIIIDGVPIDAATLSYLDSSGAPLAIPRMGVKELRAELAARHAAVAGNKKDLAKRLQKLRQDAARGATPFAQQKIARKVCPTCLQPE